MREAKVGDKIVIDGCSATIKEIYHQEFWDRFGFDIEFKDERGRYRHWKQYEDGGILIAFAE